ncbi:MAG: ABC transporter ATP-binding protein [Deltaproteobacteria bacterium GWB2_55_19]|nr:MAG: ABC transporter ATP-binding protein [Deltaproteobacteria bacterium GWB2_55_19]HAO92581.1 ABC transporter ATP-binding protein [Deltaproteobacteria bacterium]
MALINLRKISLGFGSPRLLEAIDLQIEKGERVCLVGRNGAGKSTLMRLISGEVLPDGGEISFAPGLKAAVLSQEIPKDLKGTVFDVITGGLGDVHGLMNEYHAAVAALEAGGEKALAEFERIHHELETKGAWLSTQQVETVISRLKLPADAEFSELSGGYKRRVLLGRALVAEPDLLLLDEPTNHLDLEAIDWIEEFLLGYRGTLLFVTHDRMLMQRLATRIIELDRGRLLNWQCDYGEYLKRKENLLNSEAQQNALFDKKLSEEEAWVRQGVKARRTRNEGRVRALLEMRKERGERRELEGSARIRSQETDISGKLVIEAKGIGFSYGNNDRPVIKDFSTVIIRGDKVGIMGPNGSGKTTLLNLLLGKLEPTSGTVRLGTRLEVSYFDQLRAVLDEERTVQDNIADGNDQVIIDGRPRHVIGYLQDFLFTPDRARTPVKVLSGGERNRLLLAKLFARPSNLLVMDEPTNDLDIETLDLLEEIIAEYPGTVLLVSHDRTFLNNVVTSTMVFENNELNEYIGGYDDWLRQRQEAGDKGGKKTRKEKSKKDRSVKLGFKEERELSDLPGRIEALESEQSELFSAISDPDLYRQGGQKASEVKARLDEVEATLKACYARWEELQAIKDASTGA